MDGQQVAYGNCLHVRDFTDIQFVHGMNDVGVFLFEDQGTIPLRILITCLFHWKWHQKKEDVGHSLLRCARLGEISWVNQTSLAMELKLFKMLEDAFQAPRETKTRRSKQIPLRHVGSTLVQWSHFVPENTVCIWHMVVFKYTYTCIYVYIFFLQAIFVFRRSSHTPGFWSRFNLQKRSTFGICPPRLQSQQLLWESQASTIPKISKATDHCGSGGRLSVVCPRIVFFLTKGRNWWNQFIALKL